MSTQFNSSSGSRPDRLPGRCLYIIQAFGLCLFLYFGSGMGFPGNGFAEVKYDFPYEQASLLSYILVVLSTAAAVSLFSHFRSKNMEERIDVLHHMLEKCSRTIQDSNRRLDDANTRIEKLERSDNLTGIANRRYLEEFLDREWRLAMRMSHPVSLLMINIDSLDDAGKKKKGKIDENSLKKLAHALNSTVKRPSDLAGRFAPKEFAVVLAFTPHDSAMQVAENLRSAISEIQETADKPDLFGNMTINVGVATTIPKIGSHPEELIAKADKALKYASIEMEEQEALIS